MSNCFAFIKGSRCLTDDDIANIKKDPYSYFNWDLITNLQQKLGITDQAMTTFEACIQNVKTLDQLKVCFLVLLSKATALDNMITKCGTDYNCFIKQLIALDPSLAKDIQSCIECNPICNPGCYMCSTASYEKYYIIGGIILGLLILMLIIFLLYKYKKF